MKWATAVKQNRVREKVRKRNYADRLAKARRRKAEKAARNAMAVEVESAPLRPVVVSMRSSRSNSSKPALARSKSVPSRSKLARARSKPKPARSKPAPARSKPMPARLESAKASDISSTSSTTSERRGPVIKAQPMPLVNKVKPNEVVNGPFKKVKMTVEVQRFERKLRSVLRPQKGVKVYGLWVGLKRERKNQQIRLRNKVWTQLFGESRTFGWHNPNRILMLLEAKHDAYGSLETRHLAPPNYVDYIGVEEFPGSERDCQNWLQSHPVDGLDVFNVARGNKLKLGFLAMFALNTKSGKYLKWRDARQGTSSFAPVLANQEFKKCVGYKPDQFDYIFSSVGREIEADLKKLGKEFPKQFLKYL